MKDTVFEANPQTIDELRRAITARIKWRECVCGIDNFACRLQVWPYLFQFTFSGPKKEMIYMLAKIQASIDDLMKETAANTRSIKKIKDQLKGHVDQDCCDLTEQGLDLPYSTLESFLAGEEKLNVPNIEFLSK